MDLKHPSGQGLPQRDGFILRGSEKVNGKPGMIVIIHFW
jgi:hypothetical protein